MGKKQTCSSSSSSWFSKLSGSSDLKPAKEKKTKKNQDDEASKNMSTKHRNDIHESSKRFQRMSIQKENTATKLEDMESNEKFEEIMRSVRKRVRDLQIETCGFAQVEGIMIMTPRFERRDQRLLEPKLKRSEQEEAKVKTNKPMTRTCTRAYSTETKQAHQWQKRKETKLREVKLKADQQRKSLYIRRDLNGLGTKENSKVKVFSPRASDKFRVKAIEDLKKAKLRVKEHNLMVAKEDVGMESESFAVVKCSSDPYKDFRDSMIEMIIENGINQPEELKELLVCYLKLNTDEYHDMIIKVFQQVHNDFNFHYFDAE